TGLTDISGLCTIHLPDILVVFFTASEQSLQGTLDVVESVRRARRRIPVDRGYLQVLPVPSRDESRTEYQQAAEWREIYAQRTAHLFRDFLPEGVSAADALDLMRIPNVPFWSFGERLPVLLEANNDPNNISFYYTL